MVNWFFPDAASQQRVAAGKPHHGAIERQQRRLSAVSATGDALKVTAWRSMVRVQKPMLLAERWRTGHGLG